MIHYRLTKFLKEHIGTQIFISFLPIFLAILYISIYMLDLSSIIITLQNNNRYVSQDILEDVIKEVSNFEENADGSYSVILQDEQYSEENISIGDTIFTLSIINDSWFQIVTESGARLTLTGCELFDVEKMSEGYKIIVGDNSFILDSGDIVCDVILDKDEGYTVNFSSDDIEPIKPEYISSLQLVMRNGDEYRIKVVSAYETQIDDVSLNFCTNLPTDSIYYNEVSQVFLKNLPTTSKTSFLFSSNIFIVIISVMALTILISYIGNKEDLQYMRNREIKFVNVFGVVTLVACTLVTYILL